MQLTCLSPSGCLVSNAFAQSELNAQGACVQLAYNEDMEVGVHYRWACMACIACTQQ